MYTLYHGDCLDVMPQLSGQVDAVIADIPYGTTQCAWDAVIDIPSMWMQLNRLIKSKGAIVLFAAQPFTTTLIASNMQMFKYEWVWNKRMVTNIANAKKMPLRCHENIVVFCDSLPRYNPQSTGTALVPFGKRSATQSIIVGKLGTNYQEGVGYPKSILEFSRPNNLTGGGLHPTQKPVALMEYLVKTYTNEGDTVLDFTMGSGSTGVACINTGRHFIGIEKDAGYYAITQQRLEAATHAMQQLTLEAS